MTAPEVGRQLRALRTASGRTVASVAADAGLSVPYIANLENGRGNPTVAALSQLASALGMRLVISLAPETADGITPAGAVPDAVPGSLVRLGRTDRFRRAVRQLAAALDADERDLSAQLVGAMAGVAAAVRAEPAEADWWRLLDALVLIVTAPAGR